MYKSRKDITNEASNLPFEIAQADLSPGISNVGKNIRYFRKEIAEISQQEFAMKLKISRSALSNYENGINIVPLEVALNIADWFDISLDILLFRESYLKKHM